MFLSKFNRGAINWLRLGTKRPKQDLETLVLCIPFTELVMSMGFWASSTLKGINSTDGSLIFKICFCLICLNVKQK